MKSILSNKFIIMGGFVFCLGLAAPVQSDEMPWSVLDVSLTQLIGHPEKYSGKEVRVTGFSDLKFEGGKIFFNKTGHGKITGFSDVCTGDAYVLSGKYIPSGSKRSGTWHGFLSGLKDCKKDVNEQVS